MSDILNNLIKACKWRNATMGTPVCSGELAPCAVIIESGNCPTLIKHLKEREKIVEDIWHEYAVESEE